MQLTWRENYARADQELDLDGDRSCEWHADNALELVTAARIMFAGMADGWFTGKALADYFNDTTDDPVNARQIVNGNDHDEEIADIHDQFMAALVASWNAKPMPATFVVDVPAGTEQVLLRMQKGTA